MQTIAGFMAFYITAIALSFPGATLLTLLAGAIFGLVGGTIIVSFASSIGATLAFLVSRFVLRDSIQSKFGDKLAAINTGVEKEGGFYLFTLRLVPAFPFFLINLVMGLTKMKAWTFYWVSQLGMLLGTIVYVNAGTELAKITTLKGILSPGLIGAFVALGILPIIAKKIIDGIKARKIYAKWADKKPSHYDRNVVVIGGGSAGLVTAYISAAVKAKVTLVERHQMGGDCLNTGCVPSKALIRTAKLLSHMQRSKEFGIASATAHWDFAEVMERVQRVVSEVEPHDSVERYTGLGVDCVKGTAKILTPWEVEITREDGSKQKLTTKNIVIAAGARPFVPPIPGLADVNPLTSDTIWAIRKLPKRLVVLGGGPIGCELTQCFARFGSQVTQVEMLPRIMIREDAEVSAMVEAKFRAEGVNVLTAHKALRVVQEGGEKILVVEHEGQEKKVAFDEILCAVGRIANTTGYGLEELGIPAKKVVETNEYLETIYPNIFACGDVAGPFQFTHTASHMAWYCAVNAPIRQVQEIQGRLFRGALGYLHRARSRARRFERTGSEGKRHCARCACVRHRRSGSRDRRQRSAWHGQGHHRQGQGQDSRRHHRRRARRRPAGGVRRGDEARLRPRRNSRHHPHLPYLGRGQQVRGRRVQALYRDDGQTCGRPGAERLDARRGAAWARC